MTGEEIWSENYTRDLKDVFAVQTELAQTIVEQLKGQLTNGGGGSDCQGADSSGSAGGGKRRNEKRRGA